MKHFRIFLCVFPFFLVACHTPKSDSHTEIEADSTLELTYATGFSVDYVGDYKRVAVRNPWQVGNDLAVYYLVRNDSVAVPEGGTKIRIPLEKLCLSSCTQVALLAALNQLDCVGGVCSPELIYNETLSQRIAAGEMVDIGDAFSPNIERLLLLKSPLMLAVCNQHDRTAESLERVGVLPIFNNEWTEKTPLARAEWLKFVAAFFDLEREANRLFADIEENYIDTKILAQMAGNQPSAMLGGNFKGTWYMPGGRSFMAQFLADAGADYFYKNDTTQGSLPLNFETVLNHFSSADIWLNAPCASMDELWAMDSRHALFDAAKRGNVFGFYAKTKPSGANDFWETGVVRPDLVLQDFVWAIHPELVPNCEPQFILKLQ